MKLSSQQKKEIVKAITLAEKETSGEIRVHISYSNCTEELLPLAQKQFEKLKMHHTKDRNGILLYINPKVKKFALYGDEGIHLKLGQDYWNSLKDQMRDEIKNIDLTTGICHAIEELGKQLRSHFPYSHHDKNELHNDVSESD